MKLYKDIILHQISKICCLKRILRKEYFAIKILFECQMLSEQKQISTFQKIFSILKKIKEKGQLHLSKLIELYCKKQQQFLILAMELNLILKEVIIDNHFNKIRLCKLMPKMISKIF